MFFRSNYFGVEIFALFVNQFLGGHNGVIEGFKNSMSMTNTENSITVNSGACVIQGRYIEEHTSLTIDVLDIDDLYCSLILEINLDLENTKDNFVQAQYKVLKSTDDYPELVQTDIANNVSGIYQYELARFQTGASGITNFEDKRSYLEFDSVYSGIIKDNLESDSTTSALSAKQGKVLNEKVKGTILWENDNLSSDFDPQTITLANSNWDYIEIYVTKIGCIRITKEQALEEICMNSCYGLAGLKLVVKYRNLSVINDCSKINFQEGYAYEQNNGVTLGSIDNSVIKPIKIIGYTY